MKIATGLMLGLLMAAAHGADVGVSIQVGEPGFYGRIDIGDFPRPQLIAAEPVIIAPVAVVRAPIYLHVPPGHARDWKKHCHHYNACSERVLFVRENWYNEVYVPEHQKRRVNVGRGNADKGNGKGKGKDKH
jgi:hypothetical protein